MDGNMITDTSSKAFKTLSKAHIENGLYLVGDMPCIAVSGYYGDVGDVLRVTFSSGDVLKAIITDTKKENELINHAHSDGSVIEFIVDTKTLNKDYLCAGTLNGLYKGKIIKIERMVRNDKRKI